LIVIPVIAPRHIVQADGMNVGFIALDGQAQEIIVTADAQRAKGNRCGSCVASGT
jgi:hypothetical protein